MNDLKRILDGGGTEVERLLLASGRAARPNRLAKLWTSALLAALCVGIAPKAALALQAAARRLLFTKWLIVGLGAGAATWGGARWLEYHVESGAIARLQAPFPSLKARVDYAFPETQQDSEMPKAAPGLAPERAGALVPNLAEPNASSKSRAPDTRAAREPATVASSVAAEIRELDIARKAIVSGDPRGALERLDRYVKSYPRGTLEQEQLLLRIEALSALGVMASARALARRFLVLYPQSAHRKRIQSLVGW